MHLITLVKRMRKYSTNKIIGVDLVIPYQWLDTCFEFAIRMNKIARDLGFSEKDSMTLAIQTTTGSLKMACKRIITVKK